MQLSVDGEIFSVNMREGEPGTYDFIWESGPNKGYGFSVGSSIHAPVGVDVLEDYARNFLENVDPDTGFIE